MNEPPASGAFEGGTHRLPVRVYYEDTDFTGVVYHGAFVHFLERGRTEALRALGLDHHALGERADPLAFAVRRLDVAYLKPARIDDALTVRTSFDEMSGARILALQGIFRGGEHLVKARVEVVCVSRSGRPKRLPSEILEALERIESSGERARREAP